ncbi:MAG: hypothetical protein JSR55_04615 [Proteobacteria bacterium]|nr:hypothetical protein [Pseudomonadota bacterium]
MAAARSALRLRRYSVHGRSRWPHPIFVTTCRQGTLRTICLTPEGTSRSERATVKGLGTNPSLWHFSNIASPEVQPCNIVRINRSATQAIRRMHCPRGGLADVRVERACMYVFASGLTDRHGAHSSILTLIALCALAPLGGCTGMGRPPAVSPPPLRSAPQTQLPQQHAAVPRKPAREPRAVETAPAEKTAAIDPQSLLGLAPEDVQKRLGAPNRMENGALSRKWTYAAPGCSFSVFFYPNVNSTSFRALKYGGEKSDGQRIDSSDACVRRILAGRNNDN